jgi:hypothetical protein
VTIVTALLVTTMGGEAAAQTRAGLMGGASLGLGSLAFSGTSPDPAVNIVYRGDDPSIDLAVNLYLGGRLNPRTALLFELALGAGGTDAVNGDLRVGSRRITFAGSETTNTALVYAGAVQYWVLSKFWVRGGLGVGLLDSDIFIESVDLTITLDKGAGFAVLGAAGVDLARMGNFALDAQFHVTSFSIEGLRTTAPTVQVGFTWH